MQKVRRNTLMTLAVSNYTLYKSNIEAIATGQAVQRKISIDFFLKCCGLERKPHSGNIVFSHSLSLERRETQYSVTTSLSNTTTFQFQPNLQEFSHPYWKWKHPGFYNILLVKTFKSLYFRERM